MARKRKGRPVHGWLVLDKPADVTSTQILGRVKRLFNAAKAGHAGTLDPMATGILPIAFGEATKTVSYAMDGAKQYRFTLHFGERRDTDDQEGAVVETSDVRPSPEEVAAILPRFMGEIEQVPPAYSAIKVDGERAYDLARDGAPPDLAARTIRIDDLRIVEVLDRDRIAMEAWCGKGSYMRALARDIAAALGTAGYLSDLRRMVVGPFTLDKAVTIDDLDRLSETADGADDRDSRLDACLLPVESALDDIPAVILTEPQAQTLRNGQPVVLLKRSDKERLDAMDRGRLDVDNDLIALASTGEGPVALVRVDGAALHPVRVLNLG